MQPVFSFSPDAFALALSSDHTPADVIKAKPHFKYLTKYLTDSEINAKTIVVEEEYISKDFLHDYASYYAFCFEDYPKACRRIHFFSLDFDEPMLNRFIEGSSVNIDIRGSYLGFIVVKPIPYTIIGYTLLKVYNNSPTTRQFWGAKNYDVHLHGQKLTVPSLSFQEQDSILAACATTAIWSVLNKASELHSSLLKSPSEITRDSGNLSSDGSRLFPNKGLDVRQICQAIYQSGLATDVRQPDLVLPKPPETVPPAPVLHPWPKAISKSYLKKILNAYSAIGIPLILVVGVPKLNEPYGLHAITAAGFKLPSPVARPPASEISYHSDSIEKFYAHDDQFGPFVRIEWFSDFEIETEWNHASRKTYVLQIIIPTIPKIRIPYIDIQIVVEGLDRLLSTCFGPGVLYDLVWDVKVDFSEKYKQELTLLDPSIFPNKIAHLKKSLPKYVWIATCYIADKPALKFVFDATGVSRAMLGKDIFSFLPQVATEKIFTFLDQNKANVTMVNSFSTRASASYYKFFLENIKN